MAKTGKQIEGHQLYHFSGCTYCVIVRIALWWLGLKMPLRDILSQPGNNAELIAGGGKSQVPCLRIEDDKGGVRWMYESIEIIQYLKREF